MWCIYLDTVCSSVFSHVGGRRLHQWCCRDRLHQRPGVGTGSLGVQSQLSHQWVFCCTLYKNTRASRDPEKSPFGAKLHSGSTMTRKSLKLTNNRVRLTQIWVIFRVKLTDFRVNDDPEWSLTPMDPFPGHADPGVFRVWDFKNKFAHKF